MPLDILDRFEREKEPMGFNLNSDSKDKNLMHNKSLCASIIQSTLFVI